MKLHWHDWEYVEVTNDARLLTEIELKGTHLMYRDYDGQRYYKRVCLRCGKTEDTITPRFNELRQEREINKERARRAEFLYFGKHT